MRFLTRTAPPGRPGASPSKTPMVGVRPASPGGRQPWPAVGSRTPRGCRSPPCASPGPITPRPARSGTTSTRCRWSGARSPRDGVRFRITHQDDVLVAQGNIGQDEYVVRHGLRRLAAVSKKGLRDKGGLRGGDRPGHGRRPAALHRAGDQHPSTDSLTPPPAPRSRPRPRPTPAETDPPTEALPRTYVMGGASSPAPSARGQRVSERSRNRCTSWRGARLFALTAFVARPLSPARPEGPSRSRPGPFEGTFEARLRRPRTSAAAGADVDAARIGGQRDGGPRRGPVRDHRRLRRGAGAGGLSAGAARPRRISPAPDQHQERRGLYGINMPYLITGDLAPDGQSLTARPPWTSRRSAGPIPPSRARCSAPPGH